MNAEETNFSAAARLGVACLAGVSLLAGCSDRAAGGGDGALSCEQMELRYRDELREARRCNPKLITVPQCTETVDSALVCACPLLINPANTAAVERLTDLVQRYRDGGCAKEQVCPAIGCVEPRRGRCAIDGSGDELGLCENDS